MELVLVLLVGFILILLSFLFLNVIDLVTLKLRDLLDRVKGCDDIHDLYRLRNELDELTIVFRTKRRADSITRINKIINTKINNIEK